MFMLEVLQFFIARKSHERVDDELCKLWMTHSTAAKYSHSRCISLFRSQPDCSLIHPLANKAIIVQRWKSLIHYCFSVPGLKKRAQINCISLVISFSFQFACRLVCENQLFTSLIKCFIFFCVNVCSAWPNFYFANIIYVDSRRKSR